MEDASGQNKRSAWKKIAIVASSMVMLVVVCLWTFESMGASALKKAVEQARGMGGPLTIQEVVDARKVWPNDRNGANVILAIKPSLDARVQRLEKQSCSGSQGCCAMSLT